MVEGSAGVSAGLGSDPIKEAGDKHLYLSLPAEFVNLERTRTTEVEQGKQADSSSSKAFRSKDFVS